MTQPTFVLDSSCLIKLHREQPLELYPSLWVRMSELLAHGDAVIPRKDLTSTDDAGAILGDASSGGHAARLRKEATA